MNIDEIKRYCLSLPGVERIEYGEPSNILVFYVLGRKFAYFKTSAPERWRFSMRTSPERFLELTDQEGVKPARYMHRFHWVSIVDAAAFNEDYLRELIDWSYDKAAAGLPKKRRLALAQLSSDA
ncbi:MmcQ/YjbR family DNA-binding protein [Hahella sp. HN01]|uniref:MmcQ/YjbR family DNA-binding protein n=1 Tax=Hahella sp. HN01 TaxID=2847262 RepID=UPI001C1EB461|nr:MmcQ/YjbR family DNA-binding protein [Hahella sp. HN01]MBU6953011.1 MmcQ/YjbR family DNA-binding protein [Hahella sp. HN01]